jgi:hypothetical protein
MAAANNMTPGWRLSLSKNIDRIASWTGNALNGDSGLTDARRPGA